MNEPITIAETLRMLEESFMSDVGSLGIDTPRDQITGWDSMGALMLMSELDSRFDLLLSPEESRAMRSTRDVLEYLKSHGHLKS